MVMRPVPYAAQPQWSTGTTNWPDQGIDARSLASIRIRASDIGAVSRGRRPSRARPQSRWDSARDGPHGVSARECRGDRRGARRHASAMMRATSAWLLSAESRVKNSTERKELVEHLAVQLDQERVAARGRDGGVELAIEPAKVTVNVESTARNLRRDQQQCDLGALWVLACAQQPPSRRAGPRGRDAFRRVRRRNDLPSPVGSSDHAGKMLRDERHDCRRRWTRTAMETSPCMASRTEVRATSNFSESSRSEGISVPGGQLAGRNPLEQLGCESASSRSLARSVSLLEFDALLRLLSDCIIPQRLECWYDNHTKRLQRRREECLTFCLPHVSLYSRFNAAQVPCNCQNQQRNLPFGLTN